MMLSFQQALSTAGSSRKSWQGERKEQLIKLSNGLIRQAVGSDSRGRRFSCRGIRRMGKAKTAKVSQGSGHKEKLIGQQQSD